MKEAYRNKKINTIPQGVWESSRPVSEGNSTFTNSSPATDLQGNGYPSDSRDSSARKQNTAKDDCKRNDKPAER